MWSGRFGQSLRLCERGNAIGIVQGYILYWIPSKASNSWVEETNLMPFAKKTLHFHYPRFHKQIGWQPTPGVIQRPNGLWILFTRGRCSHHTFRLFHLMSHISSHEHNMFFLQQFLWHVSCVFWRPISRTHESQIRVTEQSVYKQSTMPQWCQPNSSGWSLAF